VSAHTVALLAFCGCGFTPGRFGDHVTGDATTQDVDAATPGDDASGDTTAAAKLCDPQTGLLVCYSFDAPTFGATMANEGSAPVTAQLTSVSRSARAGGGAAETTSATKIYIPGDASLAGVLSMEMWARIDNPPTVDDTRVGLIDADATASAMSFFYYKRSTGHEIRFEIGVQRFLPQTLTSGTWHHFGQTCDNGTLTAFVDGVAIDASSGCNPGTAAAYGLIFAANNLQGGNKDSELTGAIDSIRIWTTVRTPTQICEAAGLSLCP